MIFFKVCDDAQVAPPIPTFADIISGVSEDPLPPVLTPTSPPMSSFLPKNVVRYTVPEQKPGYPWMELFAALVAGTALLCSGVVQSYTSGAIYSIQMDASSNISLTHSHVAWIASAPVLSSLLGTIICGPIMEKLGRKRAMGLLALPFILGWLVIGTALNFTMIMVGRLLTGISFGSSRTLAPIYVSETARAKHRGKLGFLPPILCAFGILMGNTLSSLMHWKTVAFLMTSIPLLLLGCSIFLPESPHWLIRRNQEDLAFRTLKRLRHRRGDDLDDLRIYQEISEIREAVDDHVTDGSASSTPFPQQGRLWDQLKEPHIRFPVVLIFLLMVFQQFSGVSAVIFYLKMILNHAESTDSNSIEGPPPPPKNHQEDMRPTIVGVVHLLAFFITLPLVDRVGRRVLLFISGILMTLSHLFLSYFFYISSSSPQVTLQSSENGTMATTEVTMASSAFAFFQPWLPLVSLCAYVLSFSLACPIPFILMTEIFASNLRSYLCSAAMLVCSLASFIVVYMFPLLMYGVSPTYAFVVFAIFSLQTSTIACIIPETKGKSLAEIENLFRGPPQFLHGKVKSVVEVPTYVTDDVCLVMITPPPNQVTATAPK